MNGTKCDPEHRTRCKTMNDCYACMLELRRDRLQAAIIMNKLSSSIWQKVCAEYWVRNYRHVQWRSTRAFVFPIDDIYVRKRCLLKNEDCRLQCQRAKRLVGGKIFIHVTASSPSNSYLSNKLKFVIYIGT